MNWATKVDSYFGSYVCVDVGQAARDRYLIETKARELCGFKPGTSYGVSLNRLQKRGMLTKQQEKYCRNLYRTLSNILHGKPLKTRDYKVLKSREKVLGALNAIPQSKKQSRSV